MKEIYYLAIEIGGTKTQLTIGTGKGRILQRVKFPVDLPRGAEGIREELERRIPDLIRNRDISGIGVGFGGPVESASGVTITSHQVVGWERFPLREWLTERFGLPSRVENDSNCAGWAEYKLGAGRGARSMVYMNIGSGIGGCLILDGRLYNGQGFGAGEIGHTQVPIPGGGHDKLENLASGWAFEHRLRETYRFEPGKPLTELTGGVRELIDGRLAAEAARRGDPEAVSAFKEEAEFVGLALANVITLLCPEVVAVGGGLSLAGSVLFEALREVVDRGVIAAFRGAYSLVPSELGEDIVTSGALLLAADNLEIHS